MKLINQYDSQRAYKFYQKLGFQTKEFKQDFGDKGLICT
jgi:hypothetical protein